MKKYILMAGLFVSFSSYANDSTQLNLKLSSALQTNNTNQKNPASIIYGGEDFSQQIATANEKSLIYKKTFVG